MCLEETVYLIEKKGKLVEEKAKPDREMKMLKGRIVRADRFGKQYITATGAPKRCADCYIDNSILSGMVLVHDGFLLDSQVKVYKCLVCDYEINRDIPIG